MRMAAASWRQDIISGAMHMFAKKLTSVDLGLKVKPSLCPDVGRTPYLERKPDTTYRKPLDAVRPRHTPSDGGSPRQSP